MVRPAADPRRFRITRVRLRYYRSIAACDVPLGDMALLVGANGSGKSSFLDALRLVSDGLQTTLDHALRDRGGVTEVRRRSTGHPTHFGVRLDFSSPRAQGSYGFQVAAVKGRDFRISHEDCVVNTFDEGADDGLFGGTSRFRIRNGELVEASEKFMPRPPGVDRLYLVNASGIPAFREVFDGLSAVNVYNVSPDAMRHPQTPDAGELLRRDGSNIASVLERLRREAPLVKERIETYLGGIVPGVRGVDREDLGAYETIEVKQNVQGATAPWSFRATSVSDGTLRALGVLTALFGGADSYASPLGVEEPETALHPAAAGLLLDALRDASSRRQVLVTSHSPDLLDSATVQPDHILAVRASEGLTTIGMLDDVARVALDESLFTAGELMRVNQLAPDPASTPEQIELFA